MNAQRGKGTSPPKAFSYDAVGMLHDKSPPASRDSSGGAQVDARAHDPQQNRVYVYRPQSQPECLEHPQTVSADPVLAGFILDLVPIWLPAL
jgi:hypothetical protein